ncbi:hypothetical protein Q8A73_009663 [Channa argus]|nr:hypothetical protein Q8A73_009663 [Channa argus]
MRQHGGGVKNREGCRFTPLQQLGQQSPQGGTIDHRAEIVGIVEHEQIQGNRAGPYMVLILELDGPITTNQVAQGATVGTLDYMHLYTKTFRWDEMEQHWCK